LTVIDTGLLLDAEDLQNDLVVAIGVRFGLGSSWAIVDFSEAKSSNVDGWGEFSRFPLSNARIAPVDSDGLWSPLDACPLVLRAEPGGVAFLALVLRRRNTHRATAASRTRITTPVTTTPATAPLFTDEEPTNGVDDVADGLLAEGMVGDGERVKEGAEEGATDRVEEGATDGVEGGGMGGCDGATRHETSTPLVTAKELDDMTLADA